MNFCLLDKESQEGVERYINSMVELKEFRKASKKEKVLEDS